MRFVNNEKDFLKYTSRRTYVTHKLFDKDYAATTLLKRILMLNYYLLYRQFDL